VENAADYAGTYDGPDGPVTVAEEGGRLFLEIEGDRVPLERRGTLTGSPSDRFWADHPSLELFELRFRRDGDEITELIHGPPIRGRGDRPLSSEPLPERWSAYPGHCRSYNPWLTNFRVIVRDDHWSWRTPGGGRSHSRRRRMACSGWATIPAPRSGSGSIRSFRATPFGPRIRAASSTGSPGRRASGPPPKERPPRRPTNSGHVVPGNHIRMS
jgi:hypothetical protein